MIGLPMTLLRRPLTVTSSAAQILVRNRTDSGFYRKKVIWSKALENKLGKGSAREEEQRKSKFTADMNNWLIWSCRNQMYLFATDAKKEKLVRASC